MGALIGIIETMINKNVGSPNVVELLCPENFNQVSRENYKNHRLLTG
jgi:hypothetical protein